MYYLKFNFCSFFQNPNKNCFFKILQYFSKISINILCSRIQGFSTPVSKNGFDRPIFCTQCSIYAHVIFITTLHHYFMFTLNFPGQYPCIYNHLHMLNFHNLLCITIMHQIFLDILQWSYYQLNKLKQGKKREETTYQCKNYEVPICTPYFKYCHTE